MNKSQHWLDEGVDLVISTLYLTILTFNDPEKETLWKNIVPKGENAAKQHFLLFPQCFSTLS